MFRYGLLALPAFTFIICFTRLPKSCADDSKLTPAEQQQFAWFDTLGFPDLSNASFVRVSTGWWSRTNNDAPVNSERLAFLLNQEGATFSVFTLDFSKYSFTRTPAGTEPHLTVAYEILDLKKTTHLELIQFIDPAAGERDMLGRRFGKMLSVRGEQFVLARGCAANGLDQLAHDLLQTTGSQAERSAEFGHVLMWRAVLKFGTPEVSRAELLEEFRRFKKNFPDSQHIERAQDTAQLLEQMVREDKEHAQLKQPPFEEMTTEQQVAELIFQLRDQNGQQWSQPGSCDFFYDSRGAESPASQLLEIGFGAVPQLIEAIEDKRFTRSVEYHRDFYFSHRVLRVGDCATTVLERIASRTFYELKYANEVTGNEPTTKQRAQEWWNEVQRKGEMQVLAEGTASGDENSPSQARQLIRNYPEAAIDAIIKGARASKDNWTRIRLVNLASKIEGEAATAFLEEEMRQGPQLASRAASAKNLLARGEVATVVPAMISEWKNGAEDLRTPRSQMTRGEADMIKVLATCGSVDAISVLSRDFESLSIERRKMIISELNIGESLFSNSLFYFDEEPELVSKTANPTPESLAAIEQLLVQAMTDTEEAEGASVTCDEKSISDPRICDLAGYVLSRRSADKYDFDLSARLPMRDLQRMTAINVWRKEQGLPLADLPARIVIPTVTAEILDPLLAGLGAETNQETRQQVIAKLERLGVGALPGIVLAIETAPESSTRVELAAAASRMANIVTDVRFSTRSVKPNESFQHRVDRLKGTQLTSNALVKLILDTLDDLPNGAFGIKLSADRYGDHTGVVINVTFVDRAEFRSGTNGWSRSHRVRLDDNSLSSGFSTSSLSWGQSANAYQDLIDAADKALAAPPHLSFEIRASVIREN
jgi:hypothetical protein